MRANKASTKNTSMHPDDAPELTDAFFLKADLHNGSRLIRRGRPPAGVTKVSTTVRFSAEVIDHFKAGGPGWQTRMDQALRQFIAEHPGQH
jgi:uncharacterized protein (DUF4415 family)